MGRQLRRIRGRFLLHGVGVVLFMTGGALVAYYGLDRLLQLRRHDQGLTLAKLQSLGHRHVGNPYRLNLSPR